MEPVGIRLFRPEDFEPLYGIDQACYPPTIAYSRSVLRMFLDEPGGRTFVAVWAGRVVGFVTVQKKAARRGHIITLDVAEPYRRRRIGSLLLKAGEEWLLSQGVLSVDLETAVDNRTAIEFWKAHGYAVQRQIDGYYGDGVDAMLMRKALGHARPQES